MTKLERIGVLEYQLDTLRKEVEEDSKIAIGCVVQFRMVRGETRLVVRTKDTIVLVNLSNGQVVHRADHLDDIAGDYKFVAATLKQYYLG